MKLDQLDGIRDSSKRELCSLLDKKILYELEQNCRRSLNRISKKVRASKQRVHYRIERLVKEGVITQFIAILNVSKLGLLNYEVWIQLEQITDKRKKEFLDYLINHKNTRWVASCGGKVDIAVAITAENIVQFDKIFKKIIETSAGIVKNYFVNTTVEYFTYPRAHIINEKENREYSYLGGEPKKIELDETEIKILIELSRNARIGTIELAKKTNVSENTVRTKIKGLEKNQVIQAYSAIIQPNKLNLIHFEILATIQNVTKEKEKELETYCLLNPHVTYYLKLVGKFDIDIAFDADSQEQFQKHIVEFRSKFADIIKEFDFIYINYTHKFDYFAGFGN